MVPAWHEGKEGSFRCWPGHLIQCRVCGHLISVLVYRTLIVLPVLWRSFKGKA